MTAHARLSARLLLVLVCSLASGCFASHGLGGSSGTDAGPRDPGARDAGPPDAGPGSEVNCGRGGTCPAGFDCCIHPADANTCVPAGTGCPDYCFDDGECGAGATCVRNACAAVGECQPLDPSCPPECPGVCACDGLTYCNACEAQNAGAPGWEEGPCSDDPELGLCQRVCARAKPVCGLTIVSCSEICAQDLADCSPAARAEVERCANLDECGVVLDCLADIPCISTI